MIQERKEEFVNELRTVMEQGDSAKQWRRNFRRDYKQEIEEEGLDFKSFVDEIIAAAQEGGDDNRQIINSMNGLLRFIIDDNGNELSYDKLRTVDVNDTIPNRKLIEETGLTISVLETQVEKLVKLAKEAGLPNTELVEEIFERMSKLLATQDSSDLEDEIQMKLEDFLEDLTEVDITLAKDRATVYRFWKRVNKEYTKFIDSIDEFVDSCNGTPLEEKAQSLWEHKPDNYVIKIKPQAITLDKKEIRLFEILESLGGKISGEARQEWTTRRQIAEDKERGDIKDYNWETGEEKYNLGLLGDEAIEHVRELSDRSTTMDPIMAHIYKSLDTPIGAEELNYFVKRLESLKAGASEVAIKKLDDKIRQLKKEAASWTEDAYLPMGDWLADFFESAYGQGVEGEIQRFTRLAEGTEKWFEDLQELLFEKQTESYAEYPVHQRQDPVQSAGGPHVSSKNEPTLGRGAPTSMDPERKQGLLEPVMKDIPPNVEKALKKLKTSLNRYYFEPLDTGYFLKETVDSYEVVESGKVIPSIERLIKPVLSSGSTQGQAYKMLRYEFGDSNAVAAEKELISGAVDRLNTLTLTKLTNFFKEANQGKKHENWAEYIDAVEDAVELLDDIFPEDEKSNRVWAAQSIANTLERRTEPDEEGHKWVMQDVKLFNENIVDIMDKPIHQDPISNLMTLLRSDALGPYIAAKQEYAKDEAKKLEQKIDTLEKVLLTFTKVEKSYNNAILDVHDAIRKSHGKSIYYGRLQVDDIEDVDYLINKIYSTYKVETNAMEISSIVKSINSLDNLSKKHGLSKEVVYIIKGLCR
tara:strand:+ start:1413 stop:3842 length:2430 start_codon:yes stop_codon:yes gene_type:complete